MGHLAMGCNTVLVHARARRSPGPAPRPGAARTMDKNHLFCPDATHFQQDLLRKRASRAFDPDSHLNTRSGAADRSQRWRRSAETDRRRDRSRWTIAKDLRGRRAKVGHLAMGCNTVLVHARRSPGPAPRPRCGAARRMDKNHLFCPDTTHFQQDLLRKRASRASDPDSFFTLSNQKLYEF